jgi:glutathione S-transferase
MAHVASDRQVLKLERRFKAKPDRVFVAWIEPKQLVQWFGPEGMTVPAHKIDPRVGGSWLTTMRGKDGQEHTVSGVYREIDRPRRLVFTWAWHNEGKRGHETEVIVEFRPDGDGTLMTLTQHSFADEHQRDLHNQGWSSSFNDLARHVEP